MSRRNDWIDRLKGAERESLVIAAGLLELQKGLTADPSKLSASGLNAADLTAARENLPRTCLSRLVTEFEGALRDYWLAGVGRQTRPDLGRLADRVAVRRRIPDDVRDAVHEVREARNAVVHHDAGRAELVSVATARRRLNRYIARLPSNW